jgi:hypothetical protein
MNHLSSLPSDVSFKFPNLEVWKDLKDYETFWMLSLEWVCRREASLLAFADQCQVFYAEYFCSFQILLKNHTEATFRTS